MSWSVHLSFSKLFSVSRLFIFPIVCLSHFSRFFNFLAIFQVRKCTFLIFHVFQCFLPYSRSYSVHFSFLTFFGVFAIFQCLQCAFLIFYVFQFFQHIPGPRVCIAHFSRFSVFLTICQVIHDCVLFFSFLAIIQVLQWSFLIVHIFQCFSPYSSSYSVCVSFSTFFSFSFFLFLFLFLFCFVLPFCRSYSVPFTLFHVFQFSCHIPAPTVCISHFLHFTVFFTIFHSLQCVYLIFHVFQFSSHLLGHAVFVSPLPRFSVFSPNSRS